MTRTTSVYRWTASTSRRGMEDKRSDFFFLPAAEKKKLKLKLSVTIWLPPGRVCADSSRAAWGATSPLPQKPTASEGPYGNVKISETARNATHQLDTSVVLSLGSVPGVCLNFKVLKKEIEKKKNLHKNRMNSAWGGLAPVFFGQRKRYLRGQRKNSGRRLMSNFGRWAGKESSGQERKTKRGFCVSCFFFFWVARKGTFRFFERSEPRSNREIPNRKKKCEGEKKKTRVAVISLLHLSLVGLVCRLCFPEKKQTSVFKLSWLPRRIFIYTAARVCKQYP